MTPAENEASEGTGMSEAAGVTVADRIAELVQQHGSLRAAALVVRTNPGYLSRLASGERSNPGDVLLRRMGLRAVKRYVRIIPAKDAEAQ